MDLNKPPKELSLVAGSWRTMEGLRPAEPLVIRPAGPLLSAVKEGWVVVTGWRDEPDQPEPVWTVVQVRRSAVVSGEGPT